MIRELIGGTQFRLFRWFSEWVLLVVILILGELIFRIVDVLLSAFLLSAFFLEPLNLVGTVIQWVLYILLVHKTWENILTKLWDVQGFPYWLRLVLTAVSIGLGAVLFWVISGDLSSQTGLVLLASIILTLSVVFMIGHREELWPESVATRIVTGACSPQHPQRDPIWKLLLGSITICAYTCTILAVFVVFLALASPVPEILILGWAIHAVTRSRLSEDSMTLFGDMNIEDRIFKRIGEAAVGIKGFASLALCGVSGLLAMVVFVVIVKGFIRFLLNESSIIQIQWGKRYSSAHAN